MEAGTLQAGTHRTFLAGVGVSAALVAAVATAFFLVGGFVAYTSWPDGSAPVDSGRHSASVGEGASGTAGAATAAAIALDDAPAAVAQAAESPSAVAIAIATGTPIPISPASGSGGPNSPGGGTGGPGPGGGGGPGPGPGPGPGGGTGQPGLLSPTVARVVEMTGAEAVGPTLRTLSFTVDGLTRPVTGALPGQRSRTGSSGKGQRGVLSGLLGR